MDTQPGPDGSPEPANPDEPVDPNPWLPRVPGDYSAAPSAAPGAASAPAPSPSSGPKRRWAWVGAGLLVTTLAVFVVIRTVDHPPPSSSAAQPPWGSSGILTPVPPGRTSADGTYLSTEGHYRAHFPTAPTVLSLPISVAGTQASTQTATALIPYTQVIAESVTPGWPDDRWEGFMDAALTALGDSERLTLQSQDITFFRDWPARTASYTTESGGAVSAVAFRYDPTRAYILVAESGAAFTELENSFVALP